MKSSTLALGCLLAVGTTTSAAAADLNIVNRMLAFSGSAATSAAASMASSARHAASPSGAQGGDGSDATSKGSSSGHDSSSSSSADCTDDTTHTNNAPAPSKPLALGWQSLLPGSIQ